MKVLSSHLAMRFYRYQGWSEEVLAPCLMESSRLRFRNDVIGDSDMSYWTLDLHSHSHFDLEKLKPHITEIRDYNGKAVQKSEWDAFLEDFNS